jgi:putative flavoprotein involved in K+ transport
VTPRSTGADYEDDPATIVRPVHDPAAARLDVAVIGGGQPGLAAGYYLRRTALDFAIFDAQTEPGGAWPHAWASLRLFSPAQHSSLPGWPMPPTGPNYPSALDAAEYLRSYEKRYGLPVHWPTRITSVTRDGEWLRLEGSTGAGAGTWWARHVISATGTWWQPYLPSHPGQRDFTGRLLHTVRHRTPEEFSDQHVVIVGGGNSAAQILADLAPAPPPPGSRAAHPACCPMTSTAAPSSTSPPNAVPRLPKGERTPTASPVSATSSPYHPYAPPETRASCTRAPCSATSHPKAWPGWTARDWTAMWSSGAPDSVPPSATSRRCTCATAPAASPPSTKPRLATSPASTCSVTATRTGPGSAALIGTGVTARRTLARITAQLGGLP